MRIVSPPASSRLVSFIVSRWTTRVNVAGQRLRFPPFLTSPSGTINGSSPSTLNRCGICLEEHFPESLSEPGLHFDGGTARVTPLPADPFPGYHVQRPLPRERLRHGVTHSLFHRADTAGVLRYAPLPARLPLLQAP